MNTYVTTAEIKTYLGISGSTNDTVLAMLNKFATDDLNGILSVSDLAFHKVTDEVHDGGTDRLELKDMHVTIIGDVYEDETLYEQDDAYDIDNYVVYFDDGLNAGEREVTIDYAAGWNAAGWATLEITNNSLITDNMTITIAPGASGAVVLTEDTEWTTGADAATTALDIAEAINDHASLGGADSGVRAFAIGATVYIVDKEPQRKTSTIALSNAAGFTLSGALLNKAVDFPEGLRGAVLLLIAGRFAKRKNAGVKSYTIGTKSVTFGSKEDAIEFKQAISQYMRAKTFIL